MADPDAPAQARREGTNPALIVGGTVVVVAIVTLLIYAVSGSKGEKDVVGRSPAAKLAAPASNGACGQGTPADASYSVDYVTTPNPPRPEGTTVQLTVRHDGQIVSGAKVCLTADMPDMQHPGLSKASNEVSGGRYEARLEFGMGGSWRMSVTVAEPGKAVVSLPLAIQVAPVDS
jgi:hypothetical protein